MGRERGRKPVGLSDWGREEREGGREGGRERGREGGREGDMTVTDSKEELKPEREERAT